MLPLAHIAGIPVEETIGTFGPAIVIAVAALTARLRGIVRKLRLVVRREGRPVSPVDESRPIERQKPAQSAM
jgi:hypothetical protein